MNIGSISSSIPVQPPQRLSEATEAKGAQENDGDSDDGTKAVKTTPVPTVNTSGQAVGQIINAVA